MYYEIFLLVLVVRVISVFLVQTFFVPDEYWQSLEVSHNLVFNYGYLTWEWMKGIRSYIPSLVFAGFYKILQIFGCDTATYLVYGPRILQALLSAYSDVQFHEWSGARKWSLFSIVTSWFWFYTGSRTLINTMECTLSSIALAKFPWPGKGIEDSSTFVWIVSLLFAIRPTSAIMWTPLCLYHLYVSKEFIFKLIIGRYFPIGLLVFLLSIVLDSIAHGSLIVSVYEFVKFNLLEDISTFYGVQPWHWYLSIGFPTILGIHFIPFVMATMVILKNRRVYSNELIMLGTITFTIAVYSCLGHKEFRFLLPLLPLALYISSRFLSAWSRKANSFHVWLAAFILLIGNIVPAWYFSIVHQRGTLDVMQPLREISMKNPNKTSLLFLMPCHSTPLYSHLHINVSTRFLTCTPNLNKIENYLDEADFFYKNPNSWLRQNYPSNGSLPSHIICFDNLLPYITDILSRYNQTHQIYHTSLPTSSRVGRYVNVYEKLDFL